MTKEKLKNLLPFSLVLLAMAFNFYTLFPELSVKADPNDNIYQFALVYRMNEVFEKVLQGQASPLAIIDHWVPYWASGYPLPYYYQHLPHLFIVLVYRALLKTVSLYAVFNWVKFLLWVFWPLSLYWGSRKLNLSPLAAALAAFWGSQIMTDGLYGADVSSFAWRGYGLTTQLFALFFAPLALGQIYHVLANYRGPEPRKKRARDIIVAVLLLAATFASHMAIGYIVSLSALFIPLSLLNISNLSLNELLRNWKLEIKNLLRHYFPLFLILAFTFLLLSYWLVPMLMGNVYHNISFWDPPVKWNSYGATNVISQLLDGQLFDFGRPPILTLLTVIGFIGSLYYFNKQHRFLALAFPFWLLLFFGRTTWGQLIDLLPMMKEMHLQRLINGLHLVAIPLIGIAAEIMRKKLRWPVLSVGILIIASFFIYRTNYRYIKLNSDWLKTANLLYKQNENDFQLLVNKLRLLPPGRIYAGRPGNWGREFKIGVTQMYLALSTAGFDLNGFLPESWSLNTDLETFFNEYRLDNYQVYNIRYLITPKNFELPKFAKIVDTFGPFILSSVETSGYFDLGTSNLFVKAKKENLLNFQHLWFTSDLPSKKEFPTLDLTSISPPITYNTQIKLIDTNLFESENQLKTLYSLAYPLAPQPKLLGKIIEEKVTDKLYQTTVEVDESCSQCLVIFKMSYHPNWLAELDEQGVTKFMVTPSFMAIKVTPGIHKVSFRYQPSLTKLPLLAIGVFILPLYLLLSL